MIKYIFILLKFSWKRDLNTRPADYESAALPTELFQHRDVVRKKLAIKFYHKLRRSAIV